ncbi:MAG: SEL1-like repeat protein, partial [Deltaproteobacteria bacterium]|nr:SEL1-like repeat protein [Deltaproteobacteria bacterium]
MPSKDSPQDLYNHAISLITDLQATKNWSKIAHMLKFAADNGIPEAQNKYGLFLKEGLGVPQDINASVELLLKAEKQGIPESSAHLANLKFRALWTPEDIPLAAERLEIAASKGDPYALFESGISKLLPSKESNFTDFEKLVPFGIAERYPLVSKIFQQAFTGFQNLKEDFYIQYHYAIIYLFGFLGTKDFPTALTWLNKSAEQGFPMAQFKLGRVLYFGVGDFVDTKAGTQWIEKAAKNGLTEAELEFGEILYSEKKLPNHCVAAAEWFHKAAIKGNDSAQFYLGSLYIFGDEIKQDLETGLLWLIEAANQDYGM